MLKLYHHPLSVGSRYVRLILGEYGTPVELIEERAWTRRTEFLRLNPAATVPVLIGPDGTAVCGGVVGGEYLDETVGAMMREKRLMPDTPAARAETRRLVEWFVNKFDAEVSGYLATERVLKQMMTPQEGGGAPDARLIRAGRANLRTHLAYVAWLARNRARMTGPKLGLADLAAAAALSVADYLGEIEWDSEPEARDWYAQLKSRPAFRPLLGDKVPGAPPPAHYADLDF